MMLYDGAVLSDETARQSAQIADVRETFPNAPKFAREP